MKRGGGAAHYPDEMIAHLHEPEICRLAARRANAADWPRVRQHLSECELCRRRLVDARLRTKAMQSAAVPASQVAAAGANGL